MATKYVSALSGPEMDTVMQDMAQHNSEAWAVGTRNGTAVQSVDDTYHNNAKYWANQANQYALTAAVLVARYNVTQANQIASALSAGKAVVALHPTQKEVYLYAGTKDISGNTYYVFQAENVDTNDEASIKYIACRTNANTWITPTATGLATSDQLSFFANAKADKASPQFTGTPITPYPDADDNSQQITNTGWVKARLGEAVDTVTQATNAKINTVNNEALSAYATDTISNADIASFTDGADNIPVKSFTGSIIPVQNLNGYDNPYPAGGGANKWDEEWEVGGISQETGQNTSASNTIRAKNICACSPSTTYYLGTNVSAIYWYGTGDAYISFDYNNASGNVRTSPSTATGFRILIKSGYGTTYHNDVAINYPSTVTTYSPYSNVCPISGWSGAKMYRTGINVWDEEWENGNINDTTGAKESGTATFRSKNYISVKPNTTYYFCGASPVRYIWAYAYDKDKNFIGRIVRPNGNNIENTAQTTPDNCYFILFKSYNNGSPAAEYVGGVSINYPSTDTTYHAYDGQTIAIDWTDEAGTVYGGTLNVTTGLLTVDWVGIDLGSINYNKNINGTNIFFYSSSTLPNLGVSSKLAIMCDRYKTEAIGQSTTGDYAICTDNNGMQIRIKDSRYDGSTAGTFKSEMSGIYAYYQIATPITYQLSPTQVATLLGSNNIFCDCGSIAELTYRADTKLYIDKMLNGNSVQTLSTSQVLNTMNVLDNSVMHANSILEPTELHPEEPEEVEPEEVEEVVESEEQEEVEQEEPEEEA